MTASHRDLTHVLARDLVAAAGASAVVLFVVVGVLLPDLPGQERSLWEQSVEEVVLAAILLPLGYRFARRRAQRHLQWLPEGRPPTPEEGAAVIEYPWAIAMVATRVWIAIGVGVLAFNVYDDTFDHPLLDEMLNASSVLLAGLTAAGVAYLVADRRLRPVYPAALAVVPLGSRVRIGLRPRLLLSWALGSGIPVVMILVLLGWRNDADLDRVIAFLAGTTLVAGAVFTAATARAVAEPLERLRGGVERVSAGDLDAVVSVDDATELGYLQAGFNTMTSGLRERRRLQDLFGRHVGEEVARRALASEVVLGGQHRRVAALFVDVTGSTRFAAEHDPADVVATLNRFFDAVVRAVTVHGGWVNKFHGDGALCVFGAPAEQHDHPARALAAARAIAGALQSLPVDFGVGVSCGLAVAGNVGAESRFEYTVIGDPVNEAARLTELAKAVPGRVLASGAIVAAAGDEGAHWAPHGSVTLRGRTEPTPTYVVAEDVAVGA